MMASRRVAPLLAALLMVPAAAAGQDTCPCVGPGMLGVHFEWEEGASEASVRMVAPGSPAAGAGLRRGDVVVRADGQAADARAMRQLTVRLQPGDTVRLDVRRDGAEHQVAVVAAPRRSVAPARISGVRVRPLDATGGILIEAPEAREALRLEAVRLDSIAARMDTLNRRILEVHQARIHGLQDTTVQRIRITADTLTERVLRGLRIEEGQRLRGEAVRQTLEGSLPAFLAVGARSAAGAEFAEMTEGLARYFGIRDGLLVVRVAPDTPAARAGLEEGDVIVRVDDQPVHTAAEFRAATLEAEAGRLRLDVVRERQPRTLELEWSPPHRVVRFRSVEP